MMGRGLSWQILTQIDSCQFFPPTLRLDASFFSLVFLGWADNFFRWAVPSPAHHACHAPRPYALSKKKSKCEEVSQEFPQEKRLLKKFPFSCSVIF